MTFTASIRYNDVKKLSHTFLGVINEEKVTDLDITFSHVQTTLTDKFSFYGEYFFYYEPYEFEVK